jgi:hypothetical protein
MALGKIGTNQIDAAATPTVASATVTGNLTVATSTVTGDLTVDTSTLKVDSTNNRVGIGTASPTNGKLEVTNSSSTVPAGHFRNTSGSGDSPSLIVQGGANNAAPNFSVLDYDGNTDFMVRGDGTVRVGGFAISGSTNFTVYGNSANSGRVADFYRQTSTTTNHIQNWYSNVGGTATIQQVHEASGDIESRTNSFGGTSDRTLKENITDATNQWDDIKALQFKNYNFIGDPDRPQLGVIAQDVEAAGMTGLVKTSEETGKMSVKYSVMYMKAVIALQEAMARIEALEARVAALEAN